MAKRVLCAPGGTFEEVLDEVSYVLRQGGNRALGAVLDQRAPLRSKIAVLYQALRDSPLVLWLDDFDKLLLSAMEAQIETRSIQYFLEGCATLAGSKSRVVVVSRERPHAGRFKELAVGDLSPELEDHFWKRIGGGAPPPWRGALPISQRTPFSWSLLISVKDRLSPTLLRSLLSSSPDPIEKIVEAAIERLSPLALEVLEALSTLPPEPSRQALRDVAAPKGMALNVALPAKDPLLSELLGWGLITAPHGDADGSTVVVPSRVQSLVERRLHEHSIEKWRGFHAATGSYFLRLASNSANLWDFVAGWREFLKAGHHDKAYEVQKTFVPELLRRGCLDLARHVLGETALTTSGVARAVALGNMAILFKNAGNYARALEIYDQVKNEFLAMGDMTNVARVLHQIGNTHYMKGDYPAARENYESSLEISTEIGDKAVGVATRIQVANVIHQCGDQEVALEHYREALTTARDLGDEGLKVAVELQMSKIHLQGKRYLEAEGLLNDAESSARSSGDLRTMVKVFEAQAMLAGKRREYDQARACYDEALRAAEGLGDSLEASATLVLMGDMEMARFQPLEALECYERARSCLESYAAKGSASAGDIEVVRKKTEERVTSMATTLGQEAFERIRKSLRGGKN
jgi:tetratricopeptide (TPR) repeat protein